MVIYRTIDGCDGKISNVTSSPRRLSGPLRVVELRGPTHDKFDACAHEWLIGIPTVLETSVVQIKSSLILLLCRPELGDTVLGYSTQQYGLYNLFFSRGGGGEFNTGLTCLSGKLCQFWGFGALLELSRGLTFPLWSPGGSDPLNPTPIDRDDKKCSCSVLKHFSI